MKCVRIEIELDNSQERIVSARAFHNHSDYKLLAIEDNRNASDVFISLAQQYSDSVICWYDTAIESHLSSRSLWPGLLAHELELRFLPWNQAPAESIASLGLLESPNPSFFRKLFGYCGPSWLVSSYAGVCRARVISTIAPNQLSIPLGMLMLTIGRRGYSVGVCGYADKNLLSQDLPNAHKTIPVFDPGFNEIACFIKRNYGLTRLLIWTVGVQLWIGRYILWALRALFVRGETPLEITALDTQRPDLVDATKLNATVDVVIPTLDRVDYLVNLVKDIAKQDLLPKAVYIIDQGEKDLVAETLNAISEENKWPFSLVVQHVNWTGVCRARNYGIKQASSDWIIFLDDDIRIPSNYISHLSSVALTYQVEAVNSRIIETSNLVQSATFPRHPTVERFYFAGVALCSRKVCQATGGFDENLDGATLEDLDFGFRLLTNGTQILYSSGAVATHLSAKQGGYRAIRIKWKDLPVRPEPWPVVLYTIKVHGPDTMVTGFRLECLLSLMKHGPMWKWWSTFKKASISWQVSSECANSLLSRPIRTDHLK